MKMSRLKRISLLALGVILILAATLQVLALNTVQETEEDEDYTLVMDPGIGPQIPSPDMKECYLYPTGNGGYTEVQKVWDPGTGQDATLAEEADEVYLVPRKIDETTYEYTDEEGYLTITMHLTDDLSSPVPLNATRYGFNWSLAAGAYTKGTVGLDIGSRNHRFYVSGIFGDYSGTPGYYAAADDQYYWLTPPSTDIFSNVYFTADTSHSVNFALKNDGSAAGTFNGEYWVTPD